LVPPYQERQIWAVSPKRLFELEAKARQIALPPLRSLTAYWRVDMCGSVDRIDEAVEALNRVPAVDSAYPEIPGGDSLVDPADDIYNFRR
jgi:hypothetical protein